MKKSLLLLVCMILFSHAQAQSWEQLNVQSFAYSKKKEHDKAIETSIKALQLAETSFGRQHIKYAASLMNLANLHKDHTNRRMQVKAETYYKQAFLHFENNSQNRGHTIEGSLNFNYGLYLDSQKVANSKQYYQKAYEIYKKNLGENHSFTQMARKKL